MVKPGINVKLKLRYGWGAHDVPLGQMLTIGGLVETEDYYDTPQDFLDVLLDPMRLEPIIAFHNQLIDRGDMMFCTSEYLVEWEQREAGATLVKPKPGEIAEVPIWES